MPPTIHRGNNYFHFIGFYNIGFESMMFILYISCYRERALCFNIQLKKYEHFLRPFLFYFKFKQLSQYESLEGFLMKLK